MDTTIDLLQCVLNEGNESVHAKSSRMSTNLKIKSNIQYIIRKEHQWSRCQENDCCNDHRCTLLWKCFSHFQLWHVLTFCHIVILCPAGEVNIVSRHFRSQKQVNKQLGDFVSLAATKVTIISRRLLKTRPLHVYFFSPSVDCLYLLRWYMLIYHVMLRFHVMFLVMLFISCMSILPYHICTSTNGIETLQNENLCKKLDNGGKLDPEADKFTRLELTALRYRGVDRVAGMYIYIFKNSF